MLSLIGEGAGQKGRLVKGLQAVAGDEVRPELGDRLLERGPPGLLLRGGPVLPPVEAAVRIRKAVVAPVRIPGEGLWLRTIGQQGLVIRRLIPHQGEQAAPQAAVLL